MFVFIFACSLKGRNLIDFVAKSTPLAPSLRWVRVAVASYIFSQAVTSS